MFRNQIMFQLFIYILNMILYLQDVTNYVISSGETRDDIDHNDSITTRKEVIFY